MEKRLSGSSKNGAGVKSEPVAPVPVFDLERVGAVPTSVLVGDRIGIHVVGLDASSGKVTFEPVAGSSPLKDQGWILLDSLSPPANFILVPVKPGKLTLSALSIRQKLNSGAETILGTTQSLSLDVTSSLRDASGKEEKPPEYLPPVTVAFPWKDVAIWGGGGLLLAALVIWLLMRFFRKPKAAPLPSVPIFIPKPEDEQALLLLLRLEQEALWTRGQYKPHYFKASEILKEYLGARYHFDAQECTSFEVLVGLEKSGLSSELLKDLRTLFDLLDRVKFTDHIPSLGEPKDVLDRARTLIQITRKPASPVVVTTAVQESEQNGAQGKEGPRAF